MAKHTQAHMSRTVDKKMSSGMRDLTKRQMEYYMGAKLLEIGIDPHGAILRWSTEDRGSREVWTCSAYWGESKTTMQQQEQAPSSNDAG